MTVVEAAIAPTAANCTDVAPSFHSQFGEDRLLAERFAGVEHGYFAEIGAYDGVSFSNTYYFEQLGWDGVLVEANPALAESCRVLRPRASVFACAVVAPGAPPIATFEIADGDPALSSLAITRDMLRRVPGRKVSRLTVPARTLDDVLRASGLPQLDFITIDVEGHEYEVLQGFSIDHWAPRIVILERNTHLPDPRIMRFMHQHSYALERTTGVNDWFVRTNNHHVTGVQYRTRLLARYYAPKLLTVWRPCVRSVLLRAGVLK
jgi:FkbM family methyltransferase